MAFLPTVALFLAVAAVDEAATDTVAPEGEDLAEEEEELAEEGETMEDDMTDGEEADEEDAARAFAECAQNTTWAEEDASQGNTLDGTTCKDVHPRDCITHPDIAGCCPKECNKDHICAGFESKTGKELTKCLNDLRWRGSPAWYDWLNPKYLGMFDWGEGVDCETLLADPKATGDNSEINLCCNASAAAARRLADAAVAEDDDAAADDAAADDEADEADKADDAEADADAEADDAAAEGGMYPKATGLDLKSKMCNGASTTTTNSDSPSSDTPTETSSGESTDGTDATATGTNSSASTFGFTALALMLVTA